MLKIKIRLNDRTSGRKHRPVCSSHARLIGIIRSGLHLINNYTSIIDEQRSRGPGVGPGSAWEEAGEVGSKNGEKEGKKEGREG